MKAVGTGESPGYPRHCRQPSHSYDWLIMKPVLVIYGTRPEAIKMAPVIAAMRRSAHLEPVVAVTGQHRLMLDQVNGLFEIKTSYDLNIIKDRQSLSGVTQLALTGLTDVMLDAKPAAVLVQGDTTTCFVAALAAFYQQIPTVHLEAGLRTGSRYNPFPEEINRRLTTQLSELHLAPTRKSRQNLIDEGVDAKSVVITGNTVIDALLDVVSRGLPFQDPRLTDQHLEGCILVTSHRRESWGEPMARTARAIARIAGLFPDTLIVLPVHLNPVVREVLLPVLKHLANVLITEPLSYGDMAQVLAKSRVVLTDSGGIQEEAPSLGKPVLVLRETTERPEAVDAGTVRLVGTDEELIVRETAKLMTDKGEYDLMARSVNPYGDGHAAGRAVQAIEHFFGLSDRPSEFIPT